MDLLNTTGMPAGYTMGMQPDGRELLVVVVKGTFNIPKPGDVAQLSAEQIPLIEADTFTGEPGFSAPIYEVDYAPIKPYCDVLLNGSAYAPQGKPAYKVQVGLKVATLTKTFVVTAPRQWTASGSIDTGQLVDFTVMPFSYNEAFGGVDNFHADVNKHSAYMQNPVGKGFHAIQDRDLIQGSPAPQTEAVKQPITRVDIAYQPMAFGPIGRGWAGRIQHAGTYDQDWIDNCFPFLPADFNVAYYQAAPIDQQIPYLQGGEEVVLVNLTPEGRTAFNIPKIDMPIVFFGKKGVKHETHAVLDTLLIEPDKGIFTLTWRASRPLQKNIFEIKQVLAGKMSRAWWRARALGKTYYPSLAHLAKANKAATDDEAES